jgi:Chalcone isomerase-like
MRLLMANSKSAGQTHFKLATTLLMLLSVTSVAAQPSGVHRPLPQQVLSKAPGMHPFGKARHTLWGIRVYDATLWIVGQHWSADEPQALDIEPARTVSAEALVKNAIAEMRDLKVGDESKLRMWQAEMRKVIPSVKEGDQVVIFCSSSNRTFVYFNDSGLGEIDDPSFCPAVMSVWLHPQTKYQSVRKSLLRH